MRTFNTTDNEAFWDGNQAPCQGALNAEPLIDLVKPFIGRTILDAGAGSGDLMKVVKQKFPNLKVFGVDIAPKSKGIIKCDVVHMPFKHDAFDTIFCTEVIEHVSHEIAIGMLKEMNKIMKTDGKLVLTTPFNETLSENMITCPNCRTTFHRWGHQQSFTEERMRELARRANFVPLHVVPIKMTKIAKFGKWFRSFFFSHLYVRFPYKGKGKLKLLLVAKK